MSDLPARPGRLTSEQREVYESITTGPRARGPQLFDMIGPGGELYGPFSAMVEYPEVGGPLAQLGEALRYRTSLSDRARELVILATAAATRSDYEWYAHAAVARHVGVPVDVIDQVAVGRSPGKLAPDEQAALDLALFLLERKRLGPEHDRLFRGALGDRALFEVAALIGYYSLLADVLAVMDVSTPPDMKFRFSRDGTDADISPS